MLKKSIHTFKGMQRDLTKSKFSPEFVYEANNIRITPRQDSSLLSVTNEKGTTQIKIVDENDNPTSLNGTYLGHCVLNNYIVIFTKNAVTGIDYIFRLEGKKDDSLEYTLVTLFQGNLRFSIKNRIDTLGYVESDKVQKVYWIDGINPMKYINIVGDYTNYTSNTFNIKPILNLQETINIESIEGASAFPCGVVQYAFTYYNKYGSESSIFYQSPLYYTHKINRAGSPEETASNLFKISISNVDNFDYIRVYSIVRTSIDSTPVVSIVKDINIKNTRSKEITVFDSNTNIQSVDTTHLLYLGREVLIPKTFTQKDNTLFLGNINLQNRFIDYKNVTIDTVSFQPKTIIKGINTYGKYSRKFQLNKSSWDITTFKYGETYRFGVQFQDPYGNWSNVIYLEDKTVDISPNIVETIIGKADVIGSQAVVTIPNDLATMAVGMGYIKMRAMVVFPTFYDRNVICQGVLNPTVFRNKSRKLHTPDCQASWFFRPRISSTHHNSPDDNPKNLDYESLVNKGGYVESADWMNVHNSGFSFSPIIGEVDTMSSFDNMYTVDKSNVTINSPDIENIRNISDNDVFLKIVGYVAFGSCESYKNVQTDNPNSKDKGIVENWSSNVSSWTSNNPNGRMLIGNLGLFARKRVFNNTEEKYERGWLIHPWQRSGSLFNDFNIGEHTESFTLKSNYTSNLRTAFLTKYLKPSTSNTYFPIYDLQLFDSEEQELVRLSTPEGKLNYYGNVDEVVTPDIFLSVPTSDGKPVKMSVNNNFFTINTTENKNNYEQLYTTPIGVDSGNVVEGDFNKISEVLKYRFNSGIVSVKYKSTPHGIFNLSDGSKTRTILPSSGTVNNLNANVTIWKSDGTSTQATSGWYSDSMHPDLTGSGAIYIKQIKENNNDIIYDSLWVGDIRKDVQESSRFGGKSEEALLMNNWIIAGPPENIFNGSKVNTIKAVNGDTYMQQYDCLKTYPYAEGDTNSVVEILSFYLETQTNIDGRYDKNIGNYIGVTNKNFNLINPVYSQYPNYFTYHSLDRSSSTINSFSNMIVWSKEKHEMEDIDTWTNIAATSNLYLDGNKGKIVSLNEFKNELFALQEQSFSHILFNSRVQIPTSDGVPIEISNNLKVDGKREISPIGCNTKYSIVSTSNGLYYQSSYDNSLMVYNGELVNLSDKLGFKQWSLNNKITDSYYDWLNKDIYFTNENVCLCYSEMLQQFTSFMPYKHLNSLFNVQDSLLACYGSNLHKCFAGDYNIFFGKYNPFNITFIENQDEPIDKTFTNLEYRADSYIDNELTDNTFDTLKVWNEYQEGTIDLVNIKDRKSSLKKKFRIWRTDIPRDSNNNRDRIRNPWTYIQLSKNDPNIEKLEFHDAVVTYVI